MLSDSKRQAISEMVYEDRGKLTFGNKYRAIDLPGLWVAGKSL